MDLVDVLRLLILMCLLPIQLWLTDQTAPADVGGAARRFSSGGYGWLSDASERMTAGSLLEAAGAPGRLLTRLSQIGSRGKRKSRRGFADGGVAGVGTAAPQPQSKAVEVERAEWFAGSRRSRMSRRGVKYRIGQVFVHKKHGYKGMIVGWDAVPKAPESWFAAMGVPRTLRNQPMYAALVDVRDRPLENSKTYVTEANIEIVGDAAEAADFQHPELKEHMLGYNTRMRIWQAVPKLRKRYPMD